MAVLYDRSVTWGGLVVGTGNKTEALIGYTTLFGDSACAFNPIGDLYKSQVRQLPQAIGVPEAIIRKAPSADLGRARPTRRRRASATRVLDRLLFWRIDKRRSVDEVVATGLRRGRLVERVDRMVAGVGVQAPGAADRQARAADGRRRLPLSAAAARLRAGVSGAAARPAVACTSSRRRSATSATSRCGRSRCCARCR